MTRRISITEESFGLLEHMSPLKIDDVILMFAKTYIGIADSLRGNKKVQVVEDIHSQIQHLVLTVPEYEKLCSKYKKESIDVVLKDMANYTNLKKYKSAYLTANKWLKNAGKDALLSATGSVEFGSEEWKRRNG